MNTSRITRLWRLSRLSIHLLLGIMEVAILFPRRSSTGRAQAISRWSQRMCHILKITVSARGEVPAPVPAGRVLVANHISWLDIFVLNTVTASQFVAKAEVRDWPILGWLCENTGTLFVTRERRQDTHRVNLEITAALNAGKCIAVFPEGSTTDGFDVIPFNASLLQPTIDAEAILAPVAIRYYDNQHSRSDAASYVGDMNLLESILRILAQPSMSAELDFLPAIGTSGRHRREVAKLAQSQIATLVLSDSPIAARPLPQPVGAGVAPH